MKNYKITFNNIAPVCISARPVFDSILAYAYAQEQLKGASGQTQKLSYSKDELIDFSPMPIEMHPDGYFMASYMFFGDQTTEYQDAWKKRWDNQNDDLADFGKNIRKVRINNGAFKAYDTKMRIVDVGGSCWFYFRSDNPGEVNRLISKHIAGIGKKRSIGKGLFESFTIKEEQENVFEKIIRPIPAKQGDGRQGISRFVAWKPPYYMPENFADCWVE